MTVFDTQSCYHHPTTRRVTTLPYCVFSSLQFSRSVVSDSLWPHGLQHYRPPFPSPTPGLKLMSIKSVMQSNHLILCRPHLLLSSIFPSIRVFSHESVLCIRWPKYWSFNFNLSPSNENSGLISFRMDWLGRKMGSTQILTRITVHIDFQFWNHLPFCVQLYTNYWLNDLELLFYVIFSSKHSNQENNFSE